MYINWLDPLIVLLLLLFVWAVRKSGVLTHLLIIIGLFGGLFFAGWLMPHLLPIHDITLKTIINGNLVLLFAAYSGVKGYDLGRYLNYKFEKTWRHTLEASLGVILNLLFGLTVVWLVASAIGRLPFEGLSNTANDSLIVQSLVQHLPPIPAVFAEFNREFNPNDPPKVFVRSNGQTELYTGSQPSGLNSAAAADEASIVRITSFGCGGVISGSGFVVASDLVITNAHVIAGARRPIVKYGSQSYAGTVVLFDPNLDLAAIRISGLHAPVLALDKQQVSAGTPIAVLGYPNGDYTVSSGVVRDNQIVYGGSIYGVGTFGRAIYEAQVAVEAGSSGGPMILQNGQVAGIIFAMSEKVKDDGFALDSTRLIKPIRHAERSTRRVSTGACVADKLL